MDSQQLKQMENEFIKNPSQWPMKDGLYMKRPRTLGEWPEFGRMIPGNNHCIYEDDLVTVRHSYESTEALQEAGWIVD